MPPSFFTETNSCDIELRLELLLLNILDMDSDSYSAFCSTIGYGKADFTVFPGLPIIRCPGKRPGSRCEGCPRGQVAGRIG
jgi:hypothetical protein